MKLLLKRKIKLTSCTIGRLYIDGDYFCITLEDVVRKKKIKHQTAIPAGTYQVIINHSVRFARDMPLLVNVPNFEGIRIHAGNTASNTSGCILIGGYVKGEFLLNSLDTFNHLFDILKKRLENEKCIITIMDDFSDK